LQIFFEDEGAGAGLKRRFMVFVAALLRDNDDARAGQGSGSKDQVVSPSLNKVFTVVLILALYYITQME